MQGLLAMLLQHGWHVWGEWHWYFRDHSRGGWIEWFASKPGTVLRCYYDHAHPARTQYCNPK